ncbi:Cyclic nucleotide-binding protein [Pseudocohnilembus persalinus]|uniref:Cyclic nucleotide-binding protein n=1 Tax=Pseudocohnilembus persalinus TaxID=266149 RepID=A0A0V0QU20_PSEPJ|nr:Cyclic nucleotide-binding protein [Pseudocohnilembus persalinus]|eukprot:KRX05687.1 Cyclic nucleotide-binding protein [Pseudocohnilembus persalinus]
MKEVQYGPDSTIIDSQNGFKNLYFLRTGQVELFKYSKTKQNKFVKNLKKGDIFNEWSFISDQIPNLGAKSKNVVQLAFIEKQDFLSILQQYPVDYEKYILFQDNLRLYNKTRGLGIKCEVCENFNHTSKSCPFINYIANQDRLIYNYNHDDQPQKRRNFERGKDQFQTLKDLELIRQEVIKFIVENSDDNNPEGDKELLKIIQKIVNHSVFGFEENSDQDDQFDKNIFNINTDQFTNGTKSYRNDHDSVQKQQQQRIGVNSSYSKEDNMQYSFQNSQQNNNNIQNHQMSIVRAFRKGGTIRISKKTFFNQIGRKNILKKFINSHNQDSFNQTSDYSSSSQMYNNQYGSNSHSNNEIDVLINNDKNHLQSDVYLNENSMPILHNMHNQIQNNTNMNSNNDVNSFQSVIRPSINNSNFSFDNNNIKINNQNMNISANNNYPSMELTRRKKQVHGIIKKPSFNMVDYEKQDTGSQKDLDEKSMCTKMSTKNYSRGVSFKKQITSPEYDQMDQQQKEEIIEINAKKKVDIIFNYFEKLQIWKHYFPHNNYDKVLEYINTNISKKPVQKVLNQNNDASKYQKISGIYGKYLNKKNNKKSDSAQIESNNIISSISQSNINILNNLNEQNNEFKNQKKKITIKKSNKEYDIELIQSQMAFGDDIQSNKNSSQNQQISQ